MQNTGRSSKAPTPLRTAYSGLAYTNHVDHTDGTSTTFTRRERPHLVFADDGCTPLALTNGVVPGGSTGDASHTLLQRVAQRAGV